MASRSRFLNVVIAGDADKLDRELKRANNGLDKLGKQTKATASVSARGYSAMRVGAVGAAGAITGLVVVGKQVVDATIEAEKSQARLRAQLKASGLSYNEYAATIEQSIQATSRLSGLDDEDLQDSFTAIVRTTGDVNEALRLNALAADIARARQMDVAKAGELVAKVAGGNVGILKRYGVAVKDGATAQEALAAAQAKFSGQAKAYGETTAGSVDRAEVAFENLQETVGEALAPAVEKAAGEVAEFVTEMQDGTGEGGEFVDTLKEVWTEAKPIVTWIGRATKNVAEFTAEHPNIAKVATGILAVGAAVKTLKFVSAVTGFSTLLAAGRTTGRGLQRIMGRAGTAAGAEAAAGTATGYAGGQAAISGAASRAGKTAGRKFAAGLIIGIPLLVWEFKDQINKLGEWFSNTGVGKIITAPQKAGEAAGKFLGSLIPGGDGTGKVRSPRIANVMGGKLMGANPALAPIASAGASAGLQVTSGMRGGAITSSGNVSYHSSGEAIDLAGAPSKMLAFARGLKRSAGSRLAELIYTPMGAGVKNGRPFTYSGQVAADHNDHVHVALDLGKPGPGIGDGYGKDRIQNLWTTAGGSAERANLAAAVALAESGGNPDAKNKNTDGSTDRGLWQINSVHGKLSTFDPKANARAAVKISSGGRNWKPWVAYTTGAYRRFLSASAASGGSGSGATASPVGVRDRQERAGSRIVNALVNRFGSDHRASQITAGRHGQRVIGGATTRGFRSLTRDAGRLATRIDDADTAFGQTERKFGQTDEDLGTADGRAKRLDELAALKALKKKQLDRRKHRAQLLTKAIAKYEALLKAGRKARDQAKGAKRAKIIERLRAYEDRLIDLQAEAKSNGVAIKDTELDIGDLDKDAAEVKATPDTGADSAPEPQSPTDKLGQALSDIELQERAGVLSPEQANAAKVSTLQAALGSFDPRSRRQVGAFGALDQRQTWEVMAQLKEAQGALEQATVDNTAALRDLKGSIDQSNAIAESTVGIQLRQAQRALGDLITGELGARTNARGFMPGTGALARL